MLRTPADQALSCLLSSLFPPSSHHACVFPHLSELLNHIDVVPGRGWVGCRRCRCGAVVRGGRGGARVEVVRHIGIELLGGLPGPAVAAARLAGLRGPGLAPSPGTPSSTAATSAAATTATSSTRQWAARAPAGHISVDPVVFGVARGREGSRSRDAVCQRPAGHVCVVEGVPARGVRCEGQADRLA